MKDSDIINETEIDLLPICSSKEEIKAILKSCGRMVGFDYNYKDNDSKARLCERFGISEEEYNNLKNLNQSLKKEKVLKYNSCRSMDYGSDF